MDAPPLAYRVNELHKVAPWGRSTTYRLVRNGLLPVRRLGAATIVMHDDLLAFLAELPRDHYVGDSVVADRSGEKSGLTST